MIYSRISSKLYNAELKKNKAPNWKYSFTKLLNPKTSLSIVSSKSELVLLKSQNDNELCKSHCYETRQDVNS